VKENLTFHCVAAYRNIGQGTEGDRPLKARVRMDIGPETH